MFNFVANIFPYIKRVCALIAPVVCYMYVIYTCTMSFIVFFSVSHCSKLSFLLYGNLSSLKLIQIR